MFSIPIKKGVLNLIVITFIIFLAQNTPTIGYFIREYMPLFPFGHPLFGIWQFVTYMFLHADINHIFFNMFALWMIGSYIEAYMGMKKFVIYYLITGISAGLIHLILFPDAPTIGASGAVYGILGAMAVLFPNERLMMLFFPIPIKAKYFVTILGGLALFNGIGGTQDGIAHFAHLGGLVSGLIILKTTSYFTYSKYIE